MNMYLDLNLAKFQYIDGFGCYHQWRSRDRNLRDRDLAQISRRDRDFVIKAETETETWKFETETRDQTFL